MHTIACNYCRVIFDFNGDEYCSEECKSKTSSRCAVCQRDFPKSIDLVCSEECLKEYMTQVKKPAITSLCAKCGAPSDKTPCCLICNERELVYRQGYGGVFDEVFSSALKSRSKLVKKTWGWEVWLVNNKDYCLKYLVFYAGMNFSYHWHLQKREAWHCLVGSFAALVDGKHFLLERGRKLELMPGEKHQLKALENSIIVEVSTQHFDEDSVREKC